MWQLKWIEPQSRWVIRTLFKRNFDGFVESAQRNVNWAMLGWDVLLGYVLLRWVF